MMNWLINLWPWRKERAEEERRVSEQFRAQLKEALLRQDDLREAVAQMKKAREVTSYRQSLESYPQ